MDFQPLEQQIQSAKQRHASLSSSLDAVTVLVWLDKNVVTVRAGTGEQHDFPIRISASTAGTFYTEHDSLSQPIRHADLDKGVMWERQKTPHGIVWFDPAAGVGAGQAGAVQMFYRGKLEAGHAKFHGLLKSQRSVWRVTTTVKPATGKPQPSSKDEFPLHLYPDVPAENVPALKKDSEYDDKEPCVVEGPGFGSTTYWPGYDHPAPLNFRYHGVARGHFLVSRRYPGVRTEFFYVVPSSAITSWLQTWVIQTVGKNTAGMAILTQIIVDVAIGFMPIVGPLYNFFQAAKGAHDAYKNWHKMSGWEKALSGLDILLATLDVPKVAGAAKAAAALKTNTTTLKNLGMAPSDARGLLAASTVLSDSAAARTLVAELSNKLKTAGHLTPSEVVKVEKLAAQIIEKLPAGERLLQKARFATRDVATARQFFHGLDVTEDMLNGLRKLKAEALVSIYSLTKDGRVTLAMRYVRWAQVDELAAGMNSVADVAKPAHVAELMAALGEDTVRALGHGDFRIPGALAAEVRKQKSAKKAYEVLMRGAKKKGKPAVEGIRASLEKVRDLPDALRPLQGQFDRVFLTANQLENLSKLNPKALAMLKDKGVADSQVREIAAIAQSADAAAAINHLADATSKKLRPDVFAGVIERLGGGVLSFTQRNGLKITPDLLAQMKQDSFKAAWLLLRGVETGAKKVDGWLEQIALKVPSKSALDDLLKTIHHPQLKGAVFGRWAVRHADALPGVSVVTKLRGAKAEANLAKMYATFGPVTTENVLLSLGKINQASHETLGRIIGDLAAGHEKAMGASLTLHYVTQHVPAHAVPAFEKAYMRKGKLPRVGLDGKVTKTGSWSRHYDLEVNGKSYEFKYWTSVEGDKVDSAMSEFLRDVVLHADTGFENLRWVFATNVEAYVDTIKDMMVDTVRRSGQALRDAKLDPAKVEADLQRALAGSLVSFQ